MARPEYTICGFVFFIIVCLLSFNGRQLTHPSFPSQQEQNSDPEYLALDKTVRDVRNSSLGFSKIFAIGLSSRTDKRDAMSMAASMTNISIEWVDGVDGSKVPAVARPPGWNNFPANTLGCWRAHMNIWQRMLRENIQTALIMEDDADWDVMIKSQLVDFARGTRALQNATEKTKSPYGDDWDLLWVGHCGMKNRKDKDQRYYVTKEDPTAIPQKLWHWYSPWARTMPDLSPPALQSNYTRVVYEAYNGICTTGYAVSLEGARRLMYRQAIAGKALPSDGAIRNACDDRDMGFSCLAPYPALIGSHHPAGSTMGDSDIGYGQKAKWREVGETFHIVYSARLNLERLISGSRLIRSQFPKDTMMPEVDLRELKIPMGEVVNVQPQDFWSEAKAQNDAKANGDKKTTKELENLMKDDARAKAQAKMKEEAKKKEMAKKKNAETPDTAS